MNLIRRIFGKYYESLASFLVMKIRPLNSKLLDRHEYCFCCGDDSRMLHNGWIINKKTLHLWNSEGVSQEYLARESLFCNSCGSSFRVRNLASAILEEYCDGAHQNLKSCINAGDLNKLNVLQINEIGGAGSLQKLIKSLPALCTTNYMPNVPFGVTLNHFRNEDMQNLSFSNESFDLVLHSEVLEHVPNYDKAIQESLRVLKLNGVAIFTVPIQLRNGKSFSRYQLNEKNEMVFLGNKIWHGWALVRCSTA